MSKKSNNQSGQTTDMDLTTGGGVDKREAVREPKRPPRVPMKAGMNLHVDESLLDRENYAYRYFAENDKKGGRIASAKAAYWEHVTVDGNNIFKPGGGGDTMFLMRLPIEYHNEDLALKKQRAQATMDQETGVKSGEYVPSGKESPLSRHISESME